MSKTTTQEPTEMDITDKIAAIDARIRAARVMQYNASQMNRAAGVFDMERLLDSLYAERDALTARFSA